MADGVLAADDGAVRAALGQELIRVKEAEPAAALGVAPDASAEAVRARFLALVKLYHPNRFARRPPDVIKLANEVFLHLRRAHQRLTERPPAVATPSPPTASAAAATVLAARASDISPPSQPRLDVDAALAARRRRVRSHPSSGGTPQSAAIELLERTRRREEEQKERFETALADLGKGQLPNARTALRTLVAESPADRRYRAHLHYVTGRIHESGGRSSEAVAEYDRALAFDADLELARSAREQLGGTSETAGAGRFGRWFRK